MNYYFVGALCHDIILYLDNYPHPDDKVHTQKVEKRSGGNSSNSLQVLSLISQAEHEAVCEKQQGTMYYIGALGDSDIPSNRLASHMQKIRVSLDYTVFRKGFEDPFSYILSAGSTRTVVNYNPLPNITLEEFFHIVLVGGLDL